MELLVTNKGNEMLRKIQLFILGMKEYRTDFTTNVEWDEIEVYDSGREFAHKITFRKYDNSF